MTIFQGLSDSGPHSTQFLENMTAPVYSKLGIKTRHLILLSFLLHSETEQDQAFIQDRP